MWPYADNLSHIPLELMQKKVDDFNNKYYKLTHYGNFNGCHSMHYSFIYPIHLAWQSPPVNDFFHLPENEHLVFQDLDYSIDITPIFQEYMNVAYNQYFMQLETAHIRPGWVEEYPETEEDALERRRKVADHQYAVNQSFGYLGYMSRDGFPSQKEIADEKKMKEMEIEIANLREELKKNAA
jgi:hypothetical protein